MRKFIFFSLTLFSLPLYSAGDSAGNGGNGSEGHLQRIAQFRVLAAITDSKNKDVLNAEEIKAVSRVIDAGLPLTMVLPEKLEKGKFLDLSGDEAVVDTDDKGRGYLLDLGKRRDNRLVQETKTRKFIIQWDFTAIKADADKEVTDVLVREVASAAIRYSNFLGVIERNDDDRELSGKLFIPKADPSQMLPSSAYRYEISRRIKELQARRELILKKLDKLRAPSERVREIQTEQKGQLEVCSYLGKYQFKPQDEGWAKNLDQIERVVIKIEKEVSELSEK